jgi:hypothetical protein
MPLSAERRAVIACNAGRLLPAVLQRVDAKRRERGGVRRADDSEDAAFFIERARALSFWGVRGPMGSARSMLRR